MNIESARPKTKSFTRPPVVINQHPKNRHDFSRKAVLPWERIYKDALNETKGKYNSKQSSEIVVFNDNILSRGIVVSEFNYYYFKPGKANFICITRAFTHE